MIYFLKFILALIYKQYNKRIKNQTNNLPVKNSILLKIKEAIFLSLLS